MREKVSSNKNHSKSGIRLFLDSLSIQTKLALIILSASILVMATGFASIIYWDIKSIRTDAVKETRTAVSVLSQDMARLVVFDEIDVAADAVNRLRAFPNIENVILYDLDGNIIFRYRKNPDLEFEAPETSEEEKILYRDDYLYVFLPGEYQSTRFGTLLFRVSTVQQKNKIFGYVKVVVLMIPLLMVLSTFVAIKFQRIFSAPILRLANVVKRVSATHDYSEKLSFDDRNEIGELYEGFNLMLEQIDFNTRKLKSANQEIEKSNSKLKNLNNHLEEQKFALDQAAKVSISNSFGEITYVNEQFCNMSKYSKEELIGKGYKVIRSGFHTEEFFKNIKKTINSGEVWRGEIQNRRKDGTHYWTFTTIVPLKNNTKDDDQFLAIHFDITDKKEAERSLRGAKEVAESAVRAQTDFVSTLSHELRSPMQSLLDMLSVILNSELSDDQKSRIAVAHRSAGALLTLFNGILDYSRILAGNLEFDSVEFIIRTTVDEIVDSFVDQAEVKGVSISTVYASDIPYIVKGDPTRLREIVSTVISMALGFTRNESVLVKVRWDQQDSGKRLIRFDVEASSLVLSSNLKIRLLNAFRRLDGSIAQVFSGAGMGPALSRQLIKMMGGDFGIESFGNEGSSFWFTVDLVAKEGRGLPELDTDSVSQSRKILLVCDDANSAKQFDEGFSKTRHSMSLTTNISNALEDLKLSVVQNSPFDMVIFDLNLPLNVVFEASRAISSDSVINDVCSVLVCAPAQRGDAEKAKEVGFKGYFTKPIKVSNFIKDLNFVWLMKDHQDTLVTRHMCIEYGASNKRRLLLVGGGNSQLIQVNSIFSKYDFGIDHSVCESEIQNIPEKSHYDLVILWFTGLEESEKYIKGIKALRNEKRSLPVIALFPDKQIDSDLWLKMRQAGIDDVIRSDVGDDEIIEMLDKWLNH